MASAGKGRERVARNFIRTYGRAQFKRLIDGFSANESGQALATEFSVSRERIRQWKNKFGETIVIYRLHPEIQRILKKQQRSSFSDDSNTSVAKKDPKKNSSQK